MGILFAVMRLPTTTIALSISLFVGLIAQQSFGQAATRRSISLSDAIRNQDVVMAKAALENGADSMAKK
jgi:hypothetical protein